MNAYKKGIAVNPTPQPLDYSPERPLLTRRRKRIIAFVSLISLTLAGWRYGPFLVDHAQYLYSQRQCAKFVMPARQPTIPSPGFATVHMPSLPTGFRGMTNPQLRFLGLRQSPGGKSFILCLRSFSRIQPRRYTSMLFHVSVRRVIGWFDDHRGQVATGAIGPEILVDADSIEPVFVDPADPSHLQLKCLAYFSYSRDGPFPAYKLTLDCYVQDNGSVQMIPHEQPIAEAFKLPKSLQDKPPTTRPGF
jgi:hypothetical protein